MTRREAYDLLESRGLPPSVARRIVDGFFGLIAEGLVSGRGVRLKNFVSFDLKKRPGRKMLNNRTKREMTIPARTTVRARFSKSLRLLLNAEKRKTGS
jgi:nucleoid DNA-binding protein